MPYPNAPYAAPGAPGAPPPWAAPGGQLPAAPGQPPVVPTTMQGPPPVAGMAPPQGAAPPMGAPAQGGLDPNMVNAVLALQGDDSQRDQLRRQYALADQLRADAKNQTKGVQAGRVYVGPGIANGIAGIADQYAAKHLADTADTRGTDLDTKVQGASRQWMDKLSAALRSGA